MNSQLTFYTINLKNTRIKMSLQELVSLELDRHAQCIGEYFEKKLKKKIRRIKFEKMSRYSIQKTGICRIVDEALGDDNKRKLVVYGSGSCHQFTYGLCKYADRFSKNYAYIHFDHHHDSWDYINSSISIKCSTFVPHILKDTNASATLYIGSDPKHYIVSDKLYLSIKENGLRKGWKFEKLKWRLAKLPEEVYLTFDLDVMLSSLISTTYDTGTLTLEELMKCISVIRDTKDIIGADVLGYEGVGKEPGREVYAEIVESLL